MGKALGIVGGLVAIGLGAWGLRYWYGDLWTVIKGSVPLMAVLGGIVALIATISSIKEDRELKKSEEEAKKEEAKKEEEKK